MKKKISPIIIILLITSKVFASPQLPDYLIYKNDTIRTYSLLVEMFLQKNRQDEGQLFGLSFRNSIEGNIGTTSNCWRGYQAIYKIENDSLFVSDIIGCHTIKTFDKKNSKKYLHKIFGKKVKNKKVFIDWFNGNLSFPINKKNNKIIRWDGVFENIYLYEKAFTIEKGILKKTNEVKNYIDLKKGIDRLKKDSINNLLFKSVQSYNWKKIDKFDCSENYLISIGKKGKVTKVIMPEYQNKDTIAKYWDTKKEYIHCLKSIKKALKDLQFDIIKRKGNPIEEKYFLEIWFNKDGTIENWTY